MFVYKIVIRAIAMSVKVRAYPSFRCTVFLFLLDLDRYSVIKTLIFKVLNSKS